MAKSEFAFATVTSVKPLMIQVDGDSTVIPAVAYGVTVKVKDRVEVRVRKPPQPPLITRTLVASGGGFVTSTSSAIATLSATKDVTDVDPTISDWSIEGSSAFSLSDENVNVDPSVFPNGTCFVVIAVTAPTITFTDDAEETWLAVSGPVGTPLTVWAFAGSSFYNSASGSATGFATVSDGSFVFELSLTITSPPLFPVAPLTGTVGVDISFYPLLVPSGSS